MQQCNITQEISNLILNSIVLAAVLNKKFKVSLALRYVVYQRIVRKYNSADELAEGGIKITLDFM